MEFTAEFTAFTAEQYRALDRDALTQRHVEVMSLLDAETLPEGVTDEMLFAEADMVIDEINRRNRANAYRAARLSAVTGGEGRVVAQSEPEPAAEPQPVQQRGLQVVREGNFTDGMEYRTALRNFINRTAPMSAEMLQRAYAEYRANDAVTLNAGYTNVTDPTFTNTYSAMVPIPVTLSEQISKEMHEYGGLYEKVNHVSYPGGYVVAEGELEGDAAWITDKETSPWNADGDYVPFSFSAHQLEYRHARSLLAQAMMSDNFKDIAGDIAQKYSLALNSAIWAGTGTGQPLGITTDDVLLGTGAGATPKATIIEVTQAQLEDWSFWVSVLYSAGYNGAYRSTGEWIMGDGTWGKYLLGLKDDNNRPIANFMGTGQAINELVEPRLNTRPVNVMAADVIPGFDELSAGDIFAAFIDPRHYTVNTQPGMPYSLVAWDDHDRNLHKTKVLMACDGRVTNHYGCILLKKKVSGG